MPLPYSHGTPRVPIHLYKEVFVSFCVTRAIEELVKHCGERLRRLDIDGAELSNISVMAVATCQHLQRLSISFAEFITDEALQHIQVASALVLKAIYSYRA